MAGTWQVKTGESAEGWAWEDYAWKGLVDCFKGFDLYPKSKEMLLEGLKEDRD